MCNFFLFDQYFLRGHLVRIPSHSNSISIGGRYYYLHCITVRRTKWNNVSINCHKLILITNTYWVYIIACSEVCTFSELNFINCFYWVRHSSRHFIMSSFHLILKAAPRCGNHYYLIYGEENELQRCSKNIPWVTLKFSNEADMNQAAWPQSMFCESVHCMEEDRELGQAPQV